MQILSTKADVLAFIEYTKNQGGTICLVPTMGFFHAGHLALMRRAGKIADVVLVTLFVNPTQFAEGEDLGSYPRDFASDCRKAEGVGVDALFCPDAQEMYPEACQTVISVPGLSHQLCGKSRPDHFKGVATVVAKLFNICQPDYAIFGEKDFQQLAVIRQMIKDLNMGVKVHSLPIVREDDGLAMSSRNTYLAGDERMQALSLSRGLSLARSLAVTGGDSRAIIEEVKAFILQQPRVVVDYVTIVNQYTLENSTRVDEDSLLAMAVKIGKTRLIDNGFLL